MGEAGVTDDRRGDDFKKAIPPLGFMASRRECDVAIIRCAVLSPEPLTWCGLPSPLLTYAELSLTSALQRLLGPRPCTQADGSNHLQRVPRAAESKTKFRVFRLQAVEGYRRLVSPLVCGPRCVVWPWTQELHSSCNPACPA